MGAPGEGVSTTRGRHRLGAREAMLCLANTILAHSSRRHHYKPQLIQWGNLKVTSLPGVGQGTHSWKAAGSTHSQVSDLGNCNFPPFTTFVAAQPIQRKEKHNFGTLQGHAHSSPYPRLQMTPSAPPNTCLPGRPRHPSCPQVTASLLGLLYKSKQ